MRTTGRFFLALCLLPIAALFLAFIAIFVIGAVSLFGAIIGGILFGAFG